MSSSAFNPLDNLLLMSGNLVENFGQYASEGYGPPSAEERSVIFDNLKYLNSMLRDRNTPLRDLTRDQARTLLEQLETSQAIVYNLDLEVRGVPRVAKSMIKARSTGYEFVLPSDPS